MRTKVGLLASVALFLVAAVAAAVAGRHPPSAALLSENTLDENVMIENVLSENLLGDNYLARNPLNADYLEPSHLPKPALLNTPEGREVLKYVVACAFRRGQRLAFHSGGDAYMFEGYIGLAPDWTSAGISNEQARWISACLMAHVNGMGVPVPISLRGTHPSLAQVPRLEAARFSAHDATFFGNFFVPGEPADAGACLGDAWLHGRNLELSTDYLEYRLCGGPSQRCSVHVTGYCSADRKPDNDVTDEGIAVYLRREDAQLLRRRCVALGGCR